MKCKVAPMKCRFFHGFTMKKTKNRNETAYNFCRTEIVKDCDLTRDVRTEGTEGQLPPNFL